jgi:hypothetical protein
MANGAPQAAVLRAMGGNQIADGGMRADWQKIETGRQKREPENGSP